MDRIYFLLTVAESGLRTAAKTLQARAKTLKTQADAETDAAKKASLQKQADKNAKLAKVLNAADAGIEAYLTEE